MSDKYKAFLNELEKREAQRVSHEAKKAGIKKQLKAIELEKVDAKSSGELDTLKTLNKKETELFSEIGVLDDILSVYNIATNPGTKLKVGKALSKMIEEIRADNTKALSSLKAGHDAAAEKLIDVKSQYIQVMAEMSGLSKQSEILKNELQEVCDFLPNDTIMPEVILNRPIYEGSLYTSYIDNKGNFTPQTFKIWLLSAADLTNEEIEVYQGGLFNKVDDVRPLSDKEMQELAKC